MDSLVLLSQTVDHNSSQKCRSTYAKPYKSLQSYLQRIHPETDGQTERLNAEMEIYLRAYINYLQDDWVPWLCMAEFAANALPSTATTVSPFFANRGFEPRMSFDIEFLPQDYQETQDLPTKMKDIWEFLQDQLTLSQTRMEDFANKNRKPPPRYRVGDKVWLSTRNIQDTKTFTKA